MFCEPFANVSALGKLSQGPTTGTGPLCDNQYTEGESTTGPTLPQLQKKSYQFYRMYIVQYIYTYTEYVDQGH